jgi:hypothetical protein
VRLSYRAVQQFVPLCRHASIVNFLMSLDAEAIELAVC